jgi:hypothetical protein
MRHEEEPVRDERSNNQTKVIKSLNRRRSRRDLSKVSSAD